MYNILTLNKIAACGIEQFPLNSFAVSSDMADADGIIVRSAAMTSEDIRSPNLKAIARAGVGYNNIPAEECAELGIVVFNTPGANAIAVKEMVVAGLLLSSRRIVDSINWTQSLAQGTDDVPKTVESNKSQFAGPELYGKKIGVIGLGAVGGLVANICTSLGMDVRGYDPGMSVDAAWALSRSVQKADSLTQLYAESDYISIHIPYNKDNEHIYNEEFFSKCKKGLRLMNFSRGELVDNKALLAAIGNGTVACYVTDFPCEELLGHKNIITIPHLAASTPETEDKCAMQAAEQLRDYLLYGNIRNSVNYPNCEMPLTGRKRICVAHRNVMNVVGPVTSACAARKLNIDNMLNKSKGAFAYTLIEVDGYDVGDIKADILKLESVLRVRVL